MGKIIHYLTEDGAQNLHKIERIAFVFFTILIILSIIAKVIPMILFMFLKPTDKDFVFP